MQEAVITAEELGRLLAAEFPETFNRDTELTIVEVWHGGCRVRQGFLKNSLRPGGTIAGTTMMMLADVAMYIALLGSIGWVPLAVTTNLNINLTTQTSTMPSTAPNLSPARGYPSSGARSLLRASVT